ncbi:preprotein translocase subunit SecA [Candidatus Adlerbacteria bacterium RIFCSPLOWO2_01_FULL_51_16]|uniref:Protein translocase subunit SecA n=1 Tax=Candidatus Adlerbacteria bacterium RIFCSPLOWO2_01_FULL_51_16 TaxID=1797243 RepID=A0A1F4XHF0_9BACT|nr:MAG: preprotein translocase subunit SecA [Candidatus Adlerbacteria bacterium RIFCSPLOWO2_01_FULL_51_16]
MFSLANLFGDASKKALSEAAPLVTVINALEPEYQALSDEALRERTHKFRNRLATSETLGDLLPEAFAAVRESARRTVKLRHFDVQLVGGVVLHHHSIAEMKTGEGKTLVATLPAYLNALLARGVHIVTVNDYLARRDAVWMGQVYAALGLSVGVINHDSSYLYDLGHKEVDEKRDQEGSFKVFHEFLRPCTRRQAYEADITYGTNSEFGFDYLRDHISYNPSDLRQRGHYYAIVDEVDSILIDEARTPLIISAPAQESEDWYRTFSRISSQLQAERDYTVDEKLKAIQLTDEGISRAEKLLGIDNLYTQAGIKHVHHLETAVRAKALFRRDKEYVVRDNEVIIVDEFTGRLQPGRRWSEGLHQAIEAKEGVKVQKESRTFASITYQNYFRLYEKLAGMTGTAKTSSEEFYKVYKLETVEIPTNQPVVRLDHNDLIFQSEKGKFEALARRVKILHEKGQPVLIGTISIERNELLSAFLKREGVPHEILNAKNHEREGEIIASAGEIGRVTVATNMAGRGVDIKLGGVHATPENYEEVKRLGGLFVVGTERHEARRIDNQLRGRSGRQGDPGETQFFVSLEDSLMRIFAPDTIKNLMGRFGIPEDEPIENRMVNRSLESAQTKIEGFNFDARKHVLEFDNVLDRQRRTVYERRSKMLVGSLDEVEAVLQELAGESEEAKQLIKKKEEELGREQMFATARNIVLQTLDMLWVEHLESMEYLRGSVNLRAYGQRDPLTEYRKEGTRLYRDLEMTLKGRVFELLEGLSKDTAQGAASLVVATPAPVISVSSGRSSTPQGEIGRNDPCPCGSGKKWKKCGMLNTPEHQQRLAGKK